MLFLFYAVAAGAEDISASIMSASGRTVSAYATGYLTEYDFFSIYPTSEFWSCDNPDVKIRYVPGFASWVYKVPPGAPGTSAEFVFTNPYWSSTPFTMTVNYRENPGASLKANYNGKRIIGNNSVEKAIGAQLRSLGYTVAGGNYHDSVTGAPKPPKAGATVEHKLTTKLEYIIGNKQNPNSFAVEQEYVFKVSYAKFSFWRDVLAPLFAVPFLFFLVYGVFGIFTGFTIFLWLPPAKLLAGLR